MSILPANLETDFTAREQEVLSHVLDLIVEEGDGFSMAKVARRASCSKETLYKWFKDREGLLTATVQWQASKVSLPGILDDTLTSEKLKTALEVFANNWLTVLTGEISIALNRLAISLSAKETSDRNDLGQIVLQNGPFAMARRLKPVFQLAISRGLLRPVETDEAFRAFFGLVVADSQIRSLLGEQKLLSAKEIQNYAKNAVAAFLSLYASDNEARQFNLDTKSQHKGE